MKKFAKSFLVTFETADYASQGKDSLGNNYGEFLIEDSLCAFL